MKKLLTILLLILLCAGMILFSTDRAEALIASHFDVDACNTCHDLHHGPSMSGGLLHEAGSEALCLACHGPLGIATEVGIHDPNSHGAGNDGYITCLECHNPHSNGNPAEPTAPTARPNINGGYNIKLIGMEIDFNDFTRLATPQIREEAPQPTGLGALKDVVFEISPDDWDRSDGFGLCNSCHGATHNAAVDCRGCHDHSGGFVGTGCTGCHDGAGGGALKVGPNSAHSEVLTGYTCEECHTAHSAGTIEIPNNPIVGINYGSNGEAGIALGSVTVTGSTEAEICWNCHATEGVSEWGVNSNSNGGVNDYDFGSLSGAIAPAWVNASGNSGADWTSAQFSYKNGSIQSTHSVDDTATTPGLDPVANLRCSYCHDVHDINNLVSDNSSGKPYLRGTWFGNPYLEDGAPQQTHSWTPQHWGNVPRGSVNNNEYGGYQIDQNNNFPTSGGAAPTWNNGTQSWDWPTGLLTVDETAGLCIICHGAVVDSMNKFDVDEGGSVETPDQSWVGTNGHSNAVLGGSGTNKANIFHTSDRAPSGVNNQGARPDMGYVNHLSIGVGYGFRGVDGRSFRLLPGMDGQLENNVSRPYGARNYQWGAVVDETTTEGRFHQFSCSKCHNPHASRLPRLMITNCLDTSHNTWDDPRAGINAVNVSNTNQFNVTLLPGSSPDNWDRTWSNTTSAQNCHRLAGDNRATPVPGFGSGWNTVTPW